jgi:uncharacterized protein (TIGR00255 family)
VEIPARQAVAAVFNRGSVTLTLTATSDAAADIAGIDEASLDALIALADRKAQQFSAIGRTIAPARLDGLMVLAKGRNVRDEAADPQTLAERDRVVLAGLNAAVEALGESRRQEGARLVPAIHGHLKMITALCREAEGLAVAQPEALKNALIEQLQELLVALPPLPEERLVQEVALLAAKADIREELDRLLAHITQAHELLAKGEPCGRRLDFLSQEFNREANTLCSKSADVALTKVGLALKSAIDQFREQIQNIE